MSKEQQQKIEVIRPELPGKENKSAGTTRPYEWDPELAQLKIVEMMVNRLPLPTIVSKPYVVRYGIYSALNSTKDNYTGYDCSDRLRVYEKVGAESINVLGEYFRSFWAWANKPKYVLMGNAGMPGQFEEKKEGIVSRIINWLRPGNKQQPQAGG